MGLRTLDPPLSPPSTPAEIFLHDDIMTAWDIRLRMVYILVFISLTKSKYLVTIFDELFQSEGVQQVYAIVTDWLSQLDECERRKIK